MYPNIRRLRKTAGIGCREAATRLGIPPLRYLFLEWGAVELRASELYRMAVCYGVSSMEILNRE